jgi:hypothetical protein
MMENDLKGPFPIFCRGHSGSRLLCEAYRRNRIWMGLTENQQRDSEEFGQEHAVVRQLIKAGFNYGSLKPAERENARKALSTLVDASKANCPNPKDYIAYGWKRPVMTFALEVVLDTFPDARVVHLIRDGRDTMLSRLDWRMSHLSLPINRMAVFGDPDISEYRGKPLNNDTVAEYRNEIEMHHWVTAVTVGMRGRKYPDRYLEVRYEDLCSDPGEVIRRVFEFLGLPLMDETRSWLVQNASVRAIGKWRGLEAELAGAIAIGEPLLNELGYM